MAGDQREAPYLDALAAYVDRAPARLHIPGHKGVGRRSRADPDPRRLGDPARRSRRDRGDRRRARADSLPAGAAARGGCMGRPAELVPAERRLGRQPRDLPGAGPRRRRDAGGPARSRARRRPAERALLDDRRAGAVGAAAVVRRARARPGPGRRPLRHARRPSPRASMRPPRRSRRCSFRRPTSAPRRAWRSSPRSPTRAASRWSWTSPGAPTSTSTPTCPRAPSAAAPTWCCRAPTRSSAA